MRQHIESIPCPFCGREPETVARHKWAIVHPGRDNASDKWFTRCPWISCDIMPITTRHTRTPEESISMWNAGKIKPLSKMKKYEKTVIA